MEFDSSIFWGEEVVVVILVFEVGRQIELTFSTARWGIFGEVQGNNGSDCLAPGPGPSHFMSNRSEQLNPQLLRCQLGKGRNPS